MLATDPTRLVALLLAAAAVTAALNTTVLPATADTEDTPAFLPTISTTASTTVSSTVSTTVSTTTVSTTASTTVSTASSAPGVSVSEHSKVVICYWGTWANYRPGLGKFVAANVDGDLCTHLVYSFAGLDTETSAIKTLDAWLDLEDNYGLQGFKKATELRLTWPHLKVMIAIGGWNEGSEKYSRMAADSDKRAAFVRSAVEFLRVHGFDGLDLDWEYPGKRGGTAADKRNFISLVAELRAAFQEEGFLLTAAIGAAKGTIDVSYDVPNMYKYLDFVNVMCYDYHGKWDKRTGHNAPLGPRPDEAGADLTLNLEYTVQYLLQLGAVPEKTVLGVPLYGRAFLLKNTHNDKMGAPAQANSFAGPFTREAGFLGYNEICSELGGGGWEERWEPCHRAPYMVKRDKWVSFDNEQSVKLKADLAWDQRLAGVMVWSIETDDFQGECGGAKFPLLRALNTALVARTEGAAAAAEVTARCEAAAYTEPPATKRPRVTRKPWVPRASSAPAPAPAPASSSSAAVQESPSESGTVCVKPNEPNPDPVDCSKFYLCANGKPHAMSCRGGTLYSAALMTCDHANNVHCHNRVQVSRPRPRPRPPGSTVTVTVTEGGAVAGDTGHTWTRVTDTAGGGGAGAGLSSEKVAIIVLAALLVAVCLLLSWCFRQRLQQLAAPHLASLRMRSARGGVGGGAKLKPGTGLGLLRSYSSAKVPWYNPAHPSNAAKLGTAPPVTIPKVQIRSLHLRDLPPLPAPAPGLDPAPVAPPRRKRSVVEIQSLAGSEEVENTQSVA